MTPPPRPAKKTAAADDMAEQAMSAKDAAPAKATKEQAAVQIWPGLTSDSAPSPGWLCLDDSAPVAPCGPNAPGTDTILRLWVVTASSGRPSCARRAIMHRHPNLTAYSFCVNLTRQCEYSEVRPLIRTPTPAVLNTYHEREARPGQAASCEHAGAATSPARTGSLPGASSPDSAHRPRPLVSTSTALFCEHPCPAVLPCPLQPPFSTDRRRSTLGASACSSSSASPPPSAPLSSRT